MCDDRCTGFWSGFWTGAGGTAALIALLAIACIIWRLYDLVQ